MKADHPSTVAAVSTVAQAALSPPTRPPLLTVAFSPLDVLRLSVPSAAAQQHCASLHTRVWVLLKEQGELACYRAERLKGNASAGVAACAGLRWSMNASIQARVEWALILTAHAVHVCTALHCTHPTAPALHRTRTAA